MKRIFALVIAFALLVPGMALANGEGNGPEGPPGLRRGNVRVRNTNINRNTNHNRNSNHNSNRNSNHNSNRNSNYNSNRQYQGQHQGQYQGQGQGQAQSIKDKNKQSVTFIEEAEDIPVSTATAPALTSGPQTCMGSTSIGGQGMSFGLSIGTTWRDSDCVRRLNANALVALGHTKAALALLAQNDDVADALKAAGVEFATLKTEKTKTANIKAGTSSSVNVMDSTYQAGFEVE